MNTKLLRILKTLLLAQVDVVGSFGIAAGGAVDADVFRGTGFTVTKIAGVGLYRVTLDAAVRSPKHFFGGAHVAQAAAADFRVDPITGGDPTTTGIFDFQVKTGATGAAVDPAAACEIHFRISLGNTSLPDNT